MLQRVRPSTTSWVHWERKRSLSVSMHLCTFDLSKIRHIKSDVIGCCCVVVDASPSGPDRMRWASTRWSSSSTTTTTCRMFKNQDKPWSLEKYMAMAEKEVLEAAKEAETVKRKEAGKDVGAVKGARQRWRRRVITALSKTVSRKWRKQLKKSEVESSTEKGSVRAGEVVEITLDVHELSIGPDRWVSICEWR